jgi:DNA-binding transcriptional MerR regulator
MQKKETSLPPHIPDKLYFKIGEVSKLAELPAYVLRFWESEFGNIRPKRTSSGQRMYRKSDVEMILKIRDLLHTKKYTIRGAKQYLRTRKSTDAEAGVAQLDLLAEVKTELEEIRQLLTD